MRIPEGFATDVVCSEGLESNINQILFQIRKTEK
jgi:hypothetical protein